MDHTEMDSDGGTTQNRTGSGTRATEALEQRQAGYSVMTLAESRGKSVEVGYAFFQLESGICWMHQHADSAIYQFTLQYVLMFQPRMILIPDNSAGDEGSISRSNMLSVLSAYFPEIKIHPVPRRTFNPTSGLGYLKRHSIIQPIHQLWQDLESKYYCLSAVGALFSYLDNLDTSSLMQKASVLFHCCSTGFMHLDMSSMQYLRLVPQPRSRGGAQRSLYHVLKKTRTKMGDRLLLSSICQPWTDPVVIETRLDALEWLLSATDHVRTSIIQQLDRTCDLGQILAQLIRVPKNANLRVAEQRISMITQLWCALSAAASIASILPSSAPESGNPHNFLQDISHGLKSAACQEIMVEIESLLDSSLLQSLSCRKTRTRLHGDPSNPENLLGLSKKYTLIFAIAQGRNGLLDIARVAYQEAVNDVFELLQEQQAQHQSFDVKTKTKYQSNSLRFVFCASASVEKQLPTDWINIQHNNGIALFSTLALEKINARISESLTEIYLLSEKLIVDLLQFIRQRIGALYILSESFARLDLLSSFAQYALSLQNLGYPVTRPEFCNTLAVKDGYHPLLLFRSGRVVPNPAYCGDGLNVQIITGVNSSGKSTYLQQLALLQIMAQMGSFVPAHFASFRIISNIFVQHPGDHNGSLSTFVHEMRIISHILNNVMNNSLVLIDELGRSTSVRDGLCIATAICEWFAKMENCNRYFVYFATHMHELVDVMRMCCPNVSHFHLPDQQLGQSFIIKPGALEEKHYGIIFAKKLGMGAKLIRRAEKIAEKIDELVRIEGDRPDPVPDIAVIYKRAMQVIHIVVNSGLGEEELRLQLVELGERLCMDDELRRVLG